MCAFKYSTSNQKHIWTKSDWLANKVSLKMKQQHDFPLLNLSVNEFTNIWKYTPTSDLNPFQSFSQTEHSRIHTHAYYKMSVNIWSIKL